MILFNLSPGQTAIYETLVDNAPQRLGGALIEETSAGVGDMLGQTVFRKQNVGSPDFMTSHLLDFPGFERMSVFFGQHRGKVYRHGDSDLRFVYPRSLPALRTRCASQCRTGRLPQSRRSKTR